MTFDRIVHLAVGLLLLFMMFHQSRRNFRLVQVITLAFACGIGTWVPDWDLILGVGFHRSPITHSVLPALACYWLCSKLNVSKFVFVGFTVGIASHLFWDIIFYGDVRWISGGNNDRLFLLLNGVFTMLLAWLASRKLRASRARMT